MARHRPVTDKTPKVSGDRRVAKTRERLLAAFRELFLERGYARTSALAITQRADVGRSTFYEHFENKDDLFRASLAGVFGNLADAAAPGADRQSLEGMLAHFLDNRRFALAVFAGPTRQLVASTLADLIATRLDPPGCSATTALTSAAIAGAQLAAIATWLSQERPRDTRPIADAILRCSAAIVASLRHAP